MSKYFSNLEVKLRNEGFLSNYAAMQSNGGTTLFNQAKNTPISCRIGPAAGVKGASLIGKMIGKKMLFTLMLEEQQQNVHLLRMARQKLQPTTKLSG